jgi:arylsulfatase A-like enzyme
VLGEIDYFTHSSMKVRDWYRNNQPVKEEGYVTQLLGKDAVARINEQNPNMPLFLYLAFTAPHAPYQAPKQYLDQYKNIADPTRRAYSAMITSMDDEIGKVARSTKENRENTLIVSERHGATSPPFSGDVDVSKRLPPTWPYRGGKACLRRRHASGRARQLAGRIKAGER